MAENRKFLIDVNHPEYKSLVADYRPVKWRMGSLVNDPSKRVEIMSSGEYAMMAVQARYTGKYEPTTLIGVPMSEVDALFAACVSVLDVERRSFSLPSGHLLHIDHYEIPGLCFAVIEQGSAEDSSVFTPADWMKAEVTMDDAYILSRMEQTIRKLIQQPELLQMQIDNTSGHTLDELEAQMRISTQVKSFDESANSDDTATVKIGAKSLVSEFFNRFRKKNVLNQVVVRKRLEPAIEHREGQHNEAVH